jgi:hypothetical protein
MIEIIKSNGRLPSRNALQYLITLPHSDNSRIFHLAAQYNRGDIIEILIQSNPDYLVLLNPENGTALHTALSSGSSHAAEVLLSNCDDVKLCTLLTTATNRGRTVFHEVVSQRDDVASLQLLFKFGKPAFGQVIETLDEDGNTPLLLAIRKGYTGVVKELLDHGANPYAKAKDSGLSCLEIAKGKGEGIRDTLLALIRSAMLATSDSNYWAKERERWAQENERVRKVEMSLIAEGKMAKYDETKKKDLSPLESALERLRVSQFEIATDNVFESFVQDGKSLQSGEVDHSLLFRSLACASSEDCCASDSAIPLKKYEDCVFERKSRVHPLFFLAHARVALRYNQPIRGAALLCYFQQIFPSLACSWFTDSELALLEPSVPSEEIKGAQGPEQKKEDKKSVMSASQTFSEWEEIKGLLSEEQKKPMEKLLKMEGLRTVKELAISIYADILADQKLRERNFHESIEPRTLNFSFVGNPGTGPSLSPFCLLFDFSFMSTIQVRPQWLVYLLNCYRKLVREQAIASYK